MGIRNTPIANRIHKINESAVIILRIFETFLFEMNTILVILTEVSIDKKTRSQIR